MASRSRRKARAAARKAGDPSLSTTQNLRRQRDERLAISTAARSSVKSPGSTRSSAGGFSRGTVYGGATQRSGPKVTTPRGGRSSRVRNIKKLPDGRKAILRARRPSPVRDYPEVEGCPGYKVFKERAEPYRLYTVAVSE